MSLPEGRLRVLFVADGYPPNNSAGAARVTQQICDGLRAMGHETLVITHGSAADTPWIRRIARGPASFMAALVGRGWRLAKGFQPDVIEFSGPVGPLLLAQPKLLGGEVPPSLGVVHGLVHLERRTVQRLRVDTDLVLSPSLREYRFRFLRAPAMMMLERLRARWCDRIGCVSAATAELWSRRYGRSRSPRVLYNPVDTDFWHPDPQAAGQLRRSLGLDDSLIVLYAGSFIARKGLDVLLRAMAVVVPRCPGAVLVLAGGEPSQEEPFRRFAEQLGIGRHVRFAGRLGSDALRQYMQAADIVTLPSRREGFPLVVVEAMSCAKSVIASDVDGVSEAIPSGQLGCTVPPGRVDALAAALCRWLADPSRRAAVGAAARQHVVEHYSLAEVLQTRLSVYGDLLRRRY